MSSFTTRARIGEVIISKTITGFTWLPWVSCSNNVTGCFQQVLGLNSLPSESAGEQGIVYGSAAEGDLSSLIHYRAYDTWASGADWQVSLPAGEEPILLAVGGRANSNEFEVESASMGSVVVATSRGFIRFFSGSGVQRYLWRMGEDMVSMAASTETVLLVHREGGTSLDGELALNSLLIPLNRS